MGEANAGGEGRRDARPPRWPGWLALALCCFAGGSVGFFSERPVYRAVGVLRFSPVKRVLSDEPAKPVSADELEAEEGMIRSRRVADLAMLGPDWAKGWPTTPDAAEELMAHVSTRHGPGGILEVMYDHPDAAIAARRVKAVVLAYKNLSIDHGRQEDETRLQVLHDRRSMLARQAMGLDLQLSELADTAGTADLAALHAKQLDEVMRLERAVGDAQAAAGTTRPANDAAPNALIARLANERKRLSETSRQQVKFEELRRQRDDARRETEVIQRRMAELTMEGLMASRLSVVSPGDAPLNPTDPRPRRTAWGALGGLGAFLVLRVVWWKWRRRRRVVMARTAFPLITHHVPKPVVAIGSGAEESGSSLEAPKPA